MRLIRTKPAQFLVMLVTALLFGCNYHTDVSCDPRYSHTVKRNFKTKRLLEVSTLNFPYTSYEDRHELAASLHGFPKIGTIDRFHAVYFERAVSDDGFDKPGLHYLEGHTTWNGKVIPIYYSLDFPTNQHKDLGNFYKDFTPLR
jgi:hypothetical protein